MSDCPRDEAIYQAGLALHRQREHDRKISDAWDVFLREVGAAMIFAAGAYWGSDFDDFVRDATHRMTWKK